MTRMSPPALIVVGIAAAASCVGSGCASLRNPAARSAGAEPARIIPMTTLTVETPVEQEEAGLAAVEEFLRRTEGYDQSSEEASAARTAAAPSPPSDPLRRDTVRPPVASQAPSEPVPDEVVTNAQVTLQGGPIERPELTIPALQAVRVRPASVDEAPDARPVPTTIANQPLAMESGRSGAPGTTDQFLKLLQSQAAEKGDFDAEWRLRLVQLALNHPADPEEYSSKLSADARDLLAALVGAGHAVRAAARDPLDFGDEALRRVEGLREVLADRADPIVAVVAFCRTVVTFGVYEEMPDTSFIAGRSIRAIVYSEIENLRSELTPEGQYRTSLSTRIEVLTEDGAPVWEREEPEIVDVCRRRRSDFFVAQRITLPPTLAAGEYVLKVMVQDQLSGKAHESSLRFPIHSPTSVAASR